MKDHLGNVRVMLADNATPLEETHYYPFGLTQRGISTRQSGPLHNKEKTFQDQQIDEDLDLNWVQFKYRNHDPQIGRFIEVDPLSEDYVYNSTYAFSENKVTAHLELEGLESIRFQDVWNNKSNLVDYISSGDILFEVAAVVNEVNPLRYAAEALSGRTVASDFAQKTSRVNAVMEGSMLLLAPELKIEAGILKASVGVMEKASVSATEKVLLNGELKVGTYKDLTKAGAVGDNLTGHHIPSAAHMETKGVSKAEGIAINMEHKAGGRHQQTFTYGTQADKSMTSRDALAAGIKDARKIYQ